MDDARPMATMRPRGGGARAISTLVLVAVSVAACARRDPGRWVAASREMEGGSWQRWNPIPDRAQLEGFLGLTPNDLWAFGSAGALLHYDGKRWTSVPGPSRDPIAALAVVGGVLWATIRHYNTTFAPSDALGEHGLLVPTVSSVDIHHFRRDGAAWTRVDVPPTTSAPPCGNKISESEMVRLRPPRGPAFSGWWFSDRDVWAIVGEGRALAHFDGWSWAVLEDVALRRLESILVRGPDDLWILGQMGELEDYESQLGPSWGPFRWALVHWDGRDWTSAQVLPDVILPTLPSPARLRGGPAGELWVLGPRSYRIETSTGARTVVGAPAATEGLSDACAEAGFFGACGAVLARRASTWTTLPTPPGAPEGTCFRLACDGHGVVWATDGARVYRWNKASWLTFDLAAEPDLRGRLPAGLSIGALAIDGAGLWAVGNGRVIIRRTLC